MKLTSDGKEDKQTMTQINRNIPHLNLGNKGNKQEKGPGIRNWEGSLAGGEAGGDRNMRPGRLWFYSKGGESHGAIWSRV